MTPEPARPSPLKRVKAWLGKWDKYLGALLAAAIGAVLLQPLGDGLTRLSYDFPFELRPDIQLDEAVIIYLDAKSHEELNQPYGKPWDRRLHADLLDKLTVAPVKAVVFDVIFDEPRADTPETDELFAKAIKGNGKVILGAEFARTSVTGIDMGRAALPYGLFTNAAAGWGNTQLPWDPADLVIRRHHENLTEVPGYALFPSLAWTTAKMLNAPALRKPGSEFVPRWLNYYGPPGTINSCSYSSLMLGDVPEDFYRNKVVFVGSKLSSDFTGAGKDEFATPYRLRQGGAAPGVEIHAATFLNLMRGDWLTRLPPPLEFSLVVLFGAAAGAGLVRAKSRRFAAEALAASLVVGVVVLAHLLAWKCNVWFAWLILPLQILIAYLYALVRHSLILLVEKNLLTRSLTLHLSPARVEQLLKDETLLKPGGKKQEVSVLFTDIADFSKMAQRKTPEDLFKMLNNYYAAALKGVHETDGTIVQLIGDAIFAVWNAPLPHPDHRARACRAAVELHMHLADFEPKHAGRPEFVTRVGVHTGTAVVGNLGSQNWFEFTAIGETVNLASRLEGLNKHLGTCILATRAIQSSVEDEMTCRYVGMFQFKGFGTPVEVYELMGKLDLAAATKPWRALFEVALQLFQAGKFTAAEAKFREVIQARRAAEPASALPGEEPAADGPSEFYLERIKEFRLQPPPEGWHGEIVMKEK